MALPSASSALSRRPPESAPTIELSVRRSRLRRRMRAADLLIVACSTSVALAVALYLASGGAAQVVDGPSALNAVGIVAGLVGTDLILVMLVLAARVPLIDRTVGQDVAIRFHRRLGKPALYLILGHLLFLSVGWALQDGHTLVDETVVLVTTPDMAIAYLGLGLLVVVVVSSIVIVRRRLPYEAWHAIHLLTYVAVLVAVPHQLSVGGVLAEGSAERIYWIALYVLAFGAVAWFRFAVPIALTHRHPMRVSSVETVAPGVISLHFTGRSLDRLRARGGQYAIWRFWSAGTWWHTHPISFSAVPTATTARITVRALGAGSARLAALRPGTRVSIEGPYGIFTDVARTASRLAIVAAGIGVTPARALLENQRLRPGETTVVLRGADDTAHYLWTEIVELTRSNGGAVYSMIGPRPHGQDSWMSGADLQRGVTITSVFPHLLESDLFVCGPAVWSDAVIRDARAVGLPEEQIHIERFDW